MAWTTPNTWTAALVTVSQFNTYIRDNMLAIFPAGPAYTSVAHSAGDFTGSGTITWTVASGDQTRFAYVEIGKTMIVSLVIATSSVSGTGTELRVAVPNGKTASNGGGAYALIDNGTSGVGRWLSTGGTYLAFYTPTNGNWTASTDNTYIYATCVFEIA